MTVKRLTTEKERDILKNSKKGRDPTKLTRQELDELIVMLAKKAGLL